MLIKVEVGIVLKDIFFYLYLNKYLYEIMYKLWNNFQQKLLFRKFKKKNLRYGVFFILNCLFLERYIYLYNVKMLQCGLI